MKPRALELWRCAPLVALLTESACERNHAAAQSASRARVLTGHNYAGEEQLAAAAIRISLGVCVGCPGVRALAGRRAKPERVVPIETRAKPEVKPRRAVKRAPLGVQTGPP